MSELMIFNALENSSINNFSQPVKSVEVNDALEKLDLIAKF